MVKKTIGILLVVVGLLALVTPFTPGSWLIFVGLELLGFRILFLDRIKAWFQNMPPDKKSKIKKTAVTVIIIIILIAGFLSIQLLGGL